MESAVGNGMFFSSFKNLYIFLNIFIEIFNIYEKALHFNISPIFNKEEEAFPPITLGCFTVHTAFIVKMPLLH